MNNPKFKFVSLNETLDEVNKLNPEKVFQAIDKDVVSFYVFHNFNNAL